MIERDSTTSQIGCMSSSSSSSTFYTHNLSCPDPMKRGREFPLSTSPIPTRDFAARSQSSQRIRRAAVWHSRPGYKPPLSSNRVASLQARTLVFGMQSQKCCLGGVSTSSQLSTHPTHGHNLRALYQHYHRCICPFMLDGISQIVICGNVFVKEHTCTTCGGT